MVALRKQDLQGFLASASQPFAVICVYGANEQKTRTILHGILTARLGSTAKDELRLETLSPQDLGKTGNPIVDLSRATGFFPGARGIACFGATEANFGAVLAFLSEWQEGDATLYIQMGPLKKSSKTRALLEKEKRAAIFAIYDDPLSRQEFDQNLDTLGLRLDQDASDATYAIARANDESLLPPFLDILKLYQGEDGPPLSTQDVMRLAPGIGESDIDEIVMALAKGNRQTLHQHLKQAEIAGTNINTILISALRHFTRLHQVKSHSNPNNALSQMRPPVFGPARDALLAQARLWNINSLETALETLGMLERQLRTASTLPQDALLERAFMKIASFAPRV